MHSRGLQEYFAVGHDLPESLFDESLLKTERSKVSLLFAGIGDARNLFMTFIMMGASAKLDEISEKKCFHFTLIDHKPVVIARDFLVLQILEKLTETPNSNAASKALYYLLYYLYITPVMPDLMYRILQSEIKVAIDALEGRREMLPLMVVPAMYRAEVLRILKEWQNDAFKEFGTRRVREQAVRQRDMFNIQGNLPLGDYGDWWPPKGCKKQEAFYRISGILMLSSRKHDKFIAESLPSLAKAYEQFDESKPRKLSDEILTAVDAEWKTNVTLIDLEWVHNCEDWTLGIDVGHDPFELVANLAKAGFPMVGGQLYDKMSHFFEGVVLCLASIKKRIKVEFCVGDVWDVLEQIRYGLIGHRQPALDASPAVQDSRTNAAASNLSKHSESDESNSATDAGPNYPELDEYPNMFDRIHLSNIPDYIGGTLSTFMIVLPLTWADKSSYVTANCLRNPTRWQSMAQFNNEYIGLSAPTDLEKTFHVRMAPMVDTDSPLALSDYQKWYHCKKSKCLADFLSRDQFETWLYRLFLKIAIPKEKNTVNQALVYSPLNLSVFIRLCLHLHMFGYPAHWLSSVLGNIVSGNISTKARPPRSEPLKIRETKADMPVLKQSTAPFIAEMTTLLSMYQVLLPFSVLTTRLPNIGTIRKYAYQVDVPLHPVPGPNHFILVFYNEDLMKAETDSLRPYFLSDETADHSGEAQRIREKGLHSLTTWTWNRPEKTVSFWFREDVMEVMKRDEWFVSVSRTDSWQDQTHNPEVVTEIKDMGVVWVDN